jgi:hypothetical protein
MRYELSKQFSEFKLPNEVKNAFNSGVQLIGSLGFTKMMMFANEVQLTNDDIDYFMNMRPQRQEDESYEDMKMRGKFSKALLKYRSQLYDYSTYNK